MKSRFFRPVLATALALAACSAPSLPAAIKVYGTSSSYSQSFDSLPFPAGDTFVQANGNDDWTNDSTLEGWTRSLSNGLTDKDFYGVPSGSAGNFPRFVNAGDVDSSDRALGAMAANSVSVAFGVVFEVAATYEVNSVDVSYRGEQWFRTGANAPKDSLQFEYKILSNYSAGSFNIYSEPGWTAVNSLDFQALHEGSNQKLDGNASGNFAAVPANGQATILFGTPVQPGEFIVFRWRCEAPTDTGQTAGLCIDEFSANFSSTGPGIAGGPNFIIIVPDDHRWDATSFIQDRIAGDFGRIARYPYLVDDGDPSTTDPHTPNMDTLAQQGLYFDNGFVVYSLCSPSRATMLTGVQPFVHGVTHNDQAFPVHSVTYATLLRAAGWSTGYFGKWHMGTQTERPGFDHVRTFYGQGSYFEAEFRDENGTLVQTTGARDPGGDDYNNWVDKVSTDYLLDFIEDKYHSDQRFVAFLGFKTPHDPRLTDSITNAPSSGTVGLDFSSLFTDDPHVSVPNMLSENGSPPAWKPSTNQGDGGANTTAYMQLIAAIDRQVGRVLDKLEDPAGDGTGRGNNADSLTHNTVVIYISDNGYFRGEHGLADKRAAYEESLRVPFMIRYPAIQPNGAGLAPTTKIGLNLDIAPTILDIAGIPVPSHMQGRSLKPLIEGNTPGDWRTSFVFSYSEDPQYAATGPADMIGIRTEAGYKLVRYAEDSGWDELFYVDRAASNDEKYENTNHIASPSYTATRDRLQADLEARLAEVGFFGLNEVRTGSLPIEMDLLTANGYSFAVEKSSDLQTWTIVTELEGNGGSSTVDLVGGAPANWDITVTGDAADYAISANSGSPSVLQTSENTLRIGSRKLTGSNDGRDAVLVFELPALPANTTLTMAQLEIYASRQYAQFDIDLWAIGIQGSTSAIIDYHETQPQNGTKLQDRLMDHNLTALPTYSTVTSSIAGGLSEYLRSFYEANPDYAGGQYLFLRLNSDQNPRDQALEGDDDRNFRVTSGNDGSHPPKLHLSYTVPAFAKAEFFRIRYGKEASP